MKFFSLLIAALVLVHLTPDAGSGLTRLPNDRAGEIVKRAIEYAGGWDSWAGKNTVEFRKTTIRYKPDGSVERKRDVRVQLCFRHAVQAHRSRRAFDACRAGKTRRWNFSRQSARRI